MLDDWYIFHLKYGLTLQELSILAALCYYATAEGKVSSQVTISALARRALVSRPTASLSLAKLEDHELIYRLVGGGYTLRLDSKFFYPNRPKEKPKYTNEPRDTKEEYAPYSVEAEQRIRGKYEYVRELWNNNPDISLEEFIEDFVMRDVKDINTTTVTVDKLISYRALLEHRKRLLHES